MDWFWSTLIFILLFLGITCYSFSMKEGKRNLCFLPVLINKVLGYYQRNILFMAQMRLFIWMNGWSIEILMKKWEIGKIYTSEFHD